MLDRIRQTRSMTVIMAEQDIEHIAYWADQVLFMVNGESGAQWRCQPIYPGT